jgi:hypothetical protein
MRWVGYVACMAETINPRRSYIWEDSIKIDLKINEVWIDSSGSR